MKTPNKKFKNSTLCTHCGYCLPVCPTYKTLNDETQSPRGRISIILALSKGEISPDEASSVLSTCLVCRSCHSACPVGVRPAKLVLSARILSPLKSSLTATLLHSITNNHRLTALASRSIQLYQNSGLQGWLRQKNALSFFSPLQRLESLIPARRSEPIPAFPTKQPGDTNTLKAALLCGCMARLFHPRTAPSTANLLKLLNIEITVLDGFGCCGSPFRESGNRKLFIKQAKKTLDAYIKIPEVDMVLCDTSVCMVTVRSYGRVLSADKKYAATAKKFSEKIQHLEVLLANRLPELTPEGYQPPDNSITFQDHCQTQHGLGTKKEPRQLLKTIAGPLSELPRAENCCGAGGDYMLRYQELSSKIRLDKLAAIDESGAKTVVGCNSGCLLNIEAGLTERHSKVKTMHLSEILWQSLSKVVK
ncbi:MAG: (Fe-S)-binding protein [Magnetococcales bacterium]|nr:(Fe-S)-binding protein [Magnetococcales bacterium]